MQTLLAHSVPSVQTEPLALRDRHWLVPASQYCPVAHGAAALHPPAQPWASAQTPEVHALAVTTVQAPMLLQVDAGFADPLAQLAAAHCFSAPGK